MMLSLKFNPYEGFFIDNQYFQVLPCTNEFAMIRGDNGSTIPLRIDQPLQILPNCTIQIKPTVEQSPFSQISIAFDAPKNIQITRSNLLFNDDFKDEIYFESPKEKTIDHLLEEEFASNYAFAKIFISHCFGGYLKKLSNIRTFKSARQCLSGNDETDLLVIIESDSKTFAILIENKINANKQDRQPERYIERGINGIKGGLWEAFETCLIAPNSYIEAKSNSDFYHNYISYEEITDMLQETVKNQSRLKFRKQKFSDAIQKLKKHIKAPNIPEAITFVNNLKEFSSRKLPNLKLQEGDANNKTLWHIFKNKKFPAGIYLKITKNEVVAVLEIKKHPNLRKWVEKNRSTFEENNFVTKETPTGTEYSFRKSVKPINCLKPFEDQLENMETCLNILFELNEIITMSINKNT